MSGNVRIIPLCGSSNTNQLIRCSLVVRFVRGCLPRDQVNECSEGTNGELLETDSFICRGKHMESNANDNDVVSPHLKGDLVLISRWVKDSLFPLCKFIYNEEDTEVGGKIHQLFVHQCLRKLSGWEEGTGDNNLRRFYSAIVWEHALKKNVIGHGLNLRRSAVYTVMTNRFVGKWRKWRSNTFWSNIH